LTIHFLLVSKGKSLDTYGIGDVTKHGFYRAKALTVDMAALF
jgi:hypothetical protein